MFLVTNGDKKIMPNVIGYSKSELDLLCKLLNIPFKHTGEGYVVSQSIKEGEIITEESILEVTMELKF